MNQKIPQHVAIIMDGNGRWAEQQGLSRSEGHRAGVDVVKRIVRVCVDKQIPLLSVWAFGRDNWARPASEVDFLMQLLLSVLNIELEELHQMGVRLIFTGGRAELSEPLQQAIKSAESYTMNNHRLILNVVFNYGGKWDIVEAVKKITQDVLDNVIHTQDITEPLFATYLNTHDLPEPDLFIRTSGEQRISNFFLWQLAYTELYFTDLCWPDFTPEEFTRALDCFAERERRYGKTSQQLEALKHV
ncbi:MAG: di-trans,poly-cis-decaprenylcistransferase [Legionella sp.]|nr:MAG: di-trans,poly-cis-decaprenylcistransferase [Legionella sp.]